MKEHAATPASEARLPLMCLAAYAVATLAAGLSPHARSVWLLENLAPLGAVVVLVATWRVFRFSDRAYAQATFLLLLHAVGSHYTYEEVPAGEWVRGWLSLSRNPYDRFVHFSFGFVAVLPMRELFFGREPRRRLWQELVLVLGLVALLAAGYELTEWWTALVVRAESAEQFLAMQGDPWDTQADVLMALVGGLLAAGVEGALAARSSRAAGWPRARRPLS